MRTIFLSIDIEADGKIPFKNSMLSFGVAAFNDRGILVATYTANLELMEGATQDEDTMKFWTQNEKQKELYQKTRQNVVSVENGMKAYLNWQKKIAKEHGARLTYTGYPLTYDFMWVYVYNCFVNDYDPAGFSGFDVKTAASVLLKKPFKQTTKRIFPQRWFPKGHKHTHIAIDDAIEQGYIAMNVMKDAGLIKP